MNLAKRACLIRLNPAGINSLKDVIPTTEKGSFEALVDEEDGRGVWVTPQGEEGASSRVLLVKWDYIATVEIMRETISD